MVQAQMSDNSIVTEIDPPSNWTTGTSNSASTDLMDVGTGTNTGTVSSTSRGIGGSTTKNTVKIKWGTRLETNLSSLVETSSKETYQTVAKWIAFNRKRFDNEFASVLKAGLVGTNNNNNNVNGSISSSNISSDRHQQLIQQRQLTCLQLINEILLDERPGTATIASSKKWDQLSDLRISVGKNVLLPVVDQLSSTGKQKIIDVLLKEWDESNVFSGPTLINQIKRKIATVPSRVITRQEEPSSGVDVSSNKEIVQPSSAVINSTHDTSSSNIMDVDDNEQVNDLSTTDELPNSLNKDKESDSTNIGLTASTGTSADDTAMNADDALALLMTTNDNALSSSNAPVLPLVSSSSINKDGKVKYDFDSMGIAESKVDPREFLEHCKSIATFQIARDLRNDGAVQLSSLLSSMPEDIRKVCSKVVPTADYSTIANDEEECNIKLPEPKARDFALRISDVLLDMDLSEQLQNIQTFHEIIQRQKRAREALLQLLIQSRCKFGSYETAAAFYDAEQIKIQLRKRSQILMDAMELEGFDMEEMDSSTSTTNKQNDTTNSSSNKKRKIDADDEFEPLTWYKKSTSTTEQETMSS